jgi:ferredoxin-NADP reductase
MNSPILNRELIPATDTLELLVRQIRFEASGINSYELMNPLDKPLPQATAGSHIDIHLPGPLVRQYSLSNDPADRDRYVFAVLKDDAGRGGSKALHKTVHVQDTIRISLPRNNFRLDETASKYILLAGGIGITPVKAMCHRLAAHNANFVLHYCSKAPEYAAFKNELTQFGPRNAVRFHHGNPANRLDIAALLAAYEEGTQLYYCGPPGFMKACATATGHWPKGSVHFENFKAPVPVLPPSAPEEGRSGPDEFDVEIPSSGQRIHVSAGQSIVEALSDAGIEIETSCLSGLCGACKVRYLSGKPDHRDFILNDDEKECYLTTCVSRCRTGPLILDL